MSAPRPPLALTALLRQIVDYAGLFPPALLPLDRALAEYLAHRQGPHAWMLARFVCPVARLDELGTLLAARSDEDPVALSILPTGGPDPGAFLESLAADLEAIEAFEAAHAERVEVIEGRLPRAVWGQDPQPVCSFLAAVADLTGGRDELAFFFEVPLDDDLEAHLPAALEALAQSPRPFGLKVRLGGATPADHPPPEPVAHVLHRCRAAGVRFKATAGLHHPFRHFRERLGGPMHGFVNVFGAAVLGAEHELPEAQLLDLLREEDPAAFTVTDEVFSWRAIAAPLSRVEEVRADHAISFGSCSFAEPVEDLRAVGWL